MTSELWRRIAFTLGALLLYRLGTYIPLPGLDLAALSGLFSDRTIQLADFFSLVSSGGGIRRAAILGLDLVPYISAAIIVQLATMASRRLRAFKKEGARGRAIVERWTRYLTVLLAVPQGVGIALAYENVPGLVADPGWLFVTTTALALTAGTMFLIWLSTQMTLRGVGNGLALLLAAGFVAQIPPAVATTLIAGRQDLLSLKQELALAAIVVATVALVVLMELGRRHIPVHYPQRQVGTLTLAERSASLTLELNNAGLMPVILASWLLSVLAWLGSLGEPWLPNVAASLEPGQPPYLILYGLFLVFGAFFYTAFVLDPDETAGNLRQHGGAIADVEPGEATAAHVDHVVSRITVIGSVYLAAVCLLPFVLVVDADVPFIFGGPPLLVVVCTLLDLMAQLRAYGGARPVGSRR